MRSGPTPRIPSFDTREVVAERGDSLSAIAARELGDGGRWREIAELNKDTIRPPDYVVRRGMKVRVPVENQ